MAEIETKDIDIEDYAFTPKEIEENGQKILDYTGIENDKVYLANKKDILTKERPAWLPEFDIEGLKYDSFLPVTVHDDKGNYYVGVKFKTGSHKVIRFAGHEFDVNDYEQKIYKMNLDVLAASVDYYLKWERENLKAQGSSRKVSLPHSLHTMSSSRYDDMRQLLQFCDNYKNEDKDVFKEYIYRKPSFRTPEAYNKQSNIIFIEQYAPLLQNLKDKKLDLNLQKQDYIDTHAKGEETSYGEKGSIDTLLADYGVKIKKQNGKALSSSEIEIIKNTVEKVWNHYGDFSDEAKNYNLVFSYADNCNQHARKAVGLFTPYYKAIGVSFFTNGKNERVASPGVIFSHEVAHWFDSLKGKDTHNWYASDKDGTLENKIALKYKEILRKRIRASKENLGEYWYRTCECFARSMEQDYAIKHGIKIDELGYLPEDVYKKEIQPMVQELLEENRRYFNLSLREKNEKNIESPEYIATNYVLEKLKTAGIEVITDREEFDNKWNSKNSVYQAMIDSFVDNTEKSIYKFDNILKDVLVQTLEDTAQPLTEVVYSRNNYNQLFKNGIIQSPVETIKMGTNQFVHLCPPDRNNLLGAIYETMTKPSIVLEKESFDERAEKFKPIHVYGKSFVNTKSSHKRAVESIIIFRDGENIAVSLHNKDIKSFVEQIKTADEIIYADKEVSRVATLTLESGGSHVVKEYQDILSSVGQKSVPFNSEYNAENILSINDLIAENKINAGKLEITKENFDVYFNIFNQNDRIYKDKPNKIASDLFNFYVKPENKNEIKEWLTEQGYKINDKKHQFYLSNGQIYGFTDGEKIYLNPEIMNSNVAVHEYTHLWDAYTQHANPELWNKGKDILKETYLWNEIKNNPEYADIADDEDLLASEVHSRICGKIAQRVLERIAKENGKITKDTVIDWENEVDTFIIKNFSEEEVINIYKIIDSSDVRKFFSLPMKDLMNGRNISVEKKQEIQIDDSVTQKNLSNKSEENIDMEKTTKQKKSDITYFVKSTAEFDMFADFEPVTGLTADEAVKKYAELQQKNVDCGIGININGDSVFNDPEAEGITVLVRSNGKDTFNVYGDTFVKQLKENNEHSQNVLTAFEDLDSAARKAGLSVEDAPYIAEKRKELFETKSENNLQELLIKALETDSEKLPIVDYSYQNYDVLFSQGYVETPIETLKMGNNQFQKFNKPDRNYLLAAAYKTLTAPSFIFDSMSLDTKDGELKPVRVYGKSFYRENSDKSRAVESVVIFREGNNIVIGTHNKDFSRFVKQIKTAEQIIYADKTVSRLCELVNNGLVYVRTEGENAQSLNPKYNESNLLSIEKLIQDNRLSTNGLKKEDAELNQNVLEKLATVENIEFNNPHVTDFGTEYYLFKPTAEYINAAKDSDNRFVMPKILFDKNYDWQMSLCRPLINNPLNHDEAALYVSEDKFWHDFLRNENIGAKLSTVTQSDLIQNFTASQANSLSEEKYGFYFEYNNDEKCADIFSSTDGDFVGSIGEGGFGYADDLSGNDSTTKIPEDDFRSVIELAQRYYDESRRANYFIERAEYTFAEFIRIDGKPFKRSEVDFNPNIFESEPKDSVDITYIAGVPDESGAFDTRKKTYGEWYEAFLNPSISKIVMSRKKEFEKAVESVEQKLSVDEQEKAIVSETNIQGSSVSSLSDKNNNHFDIYSEEFISKFGDWEKANRLEKVKESEVIYSDGRIIIDNEDFTDKVIEARKNKDLKTLKLFAKQIGSKQKGIYINKDKNIDVQLSMRNISEISSHHLIQDGHLEAMTKIDEIIKNAIWIDDIRNEDKATNPNIEKYSYFASGLNINGIDYTVKSVIGTDKDGNHYYDQRLSEIEKGKLAEILTQRMSRENSTVSLAKKYDKRLIQICQVPQMPYLEMKYGEWQPSIETAKKVMNGTLFVEKDENGVQILHDTEKGIVIGQELSDFFKKASQSEIYFDIYGEEFTSRFGDWEKANRLEKLKSAPSLEKSESVVINGNDKSLLVQNYRKAKNTKELREIAKEIGKSIKGSYLNEDLNVDISVSMSNIDEIKNHHITEKGHVEAIQYIPEIIKTGIFISEENNEDKEKHPNIEKYKYLVTGIKIGDTDYTCKSAIAVDKEGKHYYDQRLSEIEKGLLLDNLSQLMSRGKSEQSLANYDKRLLRICQIPQLPYLENVNGKWQPSIATVGKVMNGTLFVEKDENGVQILHDTEKDIVIGQDLSDFFKNASQSENLSTEEIPELKTYHTLKKEDVENLEIISDEDFSDIVDSIILNDYKHIPNVIRLPNIKNELAEKLGLEKDAAFIMKKSATHIRPDRKGSYGQAFDTEEYRKIPEVLRDADFAVVDKYLQNFQVVFDDENDNSKINKIIFNKDKIGNYLVTIGKVDRESAFSEKRNTVVAVGVAPTIQTLKTRASSTTLRASQTTDNQNISQNEELSMKENTIPKYTAFDTVTKRFNSNHADFLKKYEDAKEKYLLADGENLENFKELHEDLLYLQEGEFFEIIKESKSPEEAVAEGIRYLNAFGDDGLKYGNLYQNLDLMVEQPLSNSSRMPTAEELKNYISERYADFRTVERLSERDNEVLSCYGKIYDYLYNSDYSDEKVRAVGRSACYCFDDTIKASPLFKFYVSHLAEVRKDPFTSDREEAAAIFAIKELGLDKDLKLDVPEIVTKHLALNQSMQEAQDNLKETIESAVEEYLQDSAKEIKEKQSTFDNEIDDLIAGRLEDGHIFNLGKPGEILQKCGFPDNQRIELAEARLRMKATQGNHPFDLKDVKGLDKALQEPVGVFEYGNKEKSQNVIVNLQKDGKNFLVGVFFDQNRNGLTVSSIRGLFNRDNIDWIRWIQQGKMIYGNKEKIQVLITQQRTNLADVNNKEVRTSSDSYYLDSTENIMQKFGDVNDVFTSEFPKYAEQKERYKIYRAFNQIYQNLESVEREDAVIQADEFYDALVNNDTKKIELYESGLLYNDIADKAKEIHKKFEREKNISLKSTEESVAKKDTSRIFTFAMEIKKVLKISGMEATDENIGRVAKYVLSKNEFLRKDVLNIMKDNNCNSPENTMKFLRRIYEERFSEIKLNFPEKIKTKDVVRNKTNQQENDFSISD